MNYEGRRQFGPSRPSTQYLIVFLCVVWIGLLYPLTVTHYWTVTEMVVITVLTLAALVLLANSIYSIVTGSRQASSNRLSVTPLYLLDFGGDGLTYWELGDISSINIKHQYPYGSYLNTEIDLHFETGHRTFIVSGLAESEQFVDLVELKRKLYIEAAARNDLGRLEGHDDLRILGDCSDDSPMPPNAPALRFAATIVLAAMLTGGIIYGARLANYYYEDLRTWNSAESTNRASGYRSYLSKHPSGRWREPASLNLQKLYDEGELKYRASLNSGHDKNAAEAVLEMLRYARSTQNFQVTLAFERKLEIPPNFEEVVMSDFDIKKVLPLGDALSAEKMAGREGRLITLMSEAFAQVIPDDILEIVGKCHEKCVTLTVNYEVDPMNSVYYDLRQEKVPEPERTWYPGIYIDWTFLVRIPEQEREYKFELESSPAETITYDTNSEKPYDPNEDFAKVLSSDKGNVYDSMVASAFDDFRSNLIFRMGIGEPPVRKTDETVAEPSPSPLTPKTTKPRN
ncbi:MAG: hypothetical protein KA746_07495 [Pyrinomonadaceae bacterium]|nr:hypothetical protein [Pyrinomonadaceae bacterium]